VELSSDAVAGIVGALGGAIVGSGITAVFAGRQLRAQLKHDRELDDLAELRTILDDAAIVTAEAVRSTNRVYILLTEDVPEELTGEELDETPDQETIELAIQQLRGLMGQQQEAHSDFHESPPAVFAMLQSAPTRSNRPDHGELPRGVRGVGRLHERAGRSIRGACAAGPIRAVRR
jgi:hypothetical protein